MVIIVIVLIVVIAIYQNIGSEGSGCTASYKKGVVMKRRALALVLAAALSLGISPGAALANDSVPDTTVSVTAQANTVVSTEEELRQAIASAQDGDTITLGADIDIVAQDLDNGEAANPQITISHSITLDLAGHTIGWDDASVSNELNSTIVLFAIDGCQVMFTGNGTIDAEAGYNNSYGTNIINNGSATVLNGTYTGATSAFQVQSGTLTVFGGTFKQAKTIADAMPDYAKYVINCIDANFKDGTARIYLKGGSFCYDYSDTPEGAGTSYIAPGYQVSKNGTMYAVTSSDGTTTSSPEVNEGVAETTVAGNYSGSDEALTIDAEVADGQDVSSARVTFASNSLSSIANNASVQTVTIETNVGTVSIDKTAWNAMVANATIAQGAVNDVTITIKKDDEASNPDATLYTLTAIDSFGREVYCVDNASGSIVVSVPYTISDSPKVYYLGDNGASLVDSTLDEGTLSWTVDHFSTYAVLPGDAAAEIKKSDGSTMVYSSLEEAIVAIKDGDTVKLLDNVVVDGTNKQNNDGILTLDNVKNVTIDGNGYTISAKNVTVVDGTKAPSMFNIVNNAEVTVKNLTIDGSVNGASVVKHGLNAWNGAVLTVSNVTAKSCVGYAIVANSSNLTVNSLTTTGNGWGGINVDNSPNGSTAGTTVTINDATIKESNSIKIERSYTGGDSSIVINDGSFKHIVNGIADTPELDLIIKGGTFSTRLTTDGAINPGDYVADGLEWNPSTGEVVTKTDKPSEPSEPSHPVTPSKPTYQVNIAKAENGSISVKPAKAEQGAKVTITVTPDEGFKLDTIAVADKDGKAIETTLNDNGTYTFTMPKGEVTITAAFVCDGGELCPTHGFTDVDQSMWYHDAIDWAVTNKVMKGYEGTTLFGPEDSLTREQAATVMWNIMGGGNLDASAVDLADVLQSAWYAPYVNWAYEADIMRGYTGSDIFGVGDALTREQFAQIIANATKADLSDVDTSVLDEFEDPSSVSEWAEKTMAWAVDQGIIHGVDDTKLQGNRSITRAEMATMVKNAVDAGVITLGK